MERRHPCLRLGPQAPLPADCDAPASSDALPYVSLAARPILDPETQEDLRETGLRFSTDVQPGFRRQWTEKGPRYFDKKGAPIRDASTVERINSLAIPPAWTDVWICPYANGHLQATGRDQRGRKQFLYHPDWRAHREQTKFERLREFGLALPKLRQKVERDLRKRSLVRDRVIATVVRLLEATLIRVGNRTYAVQNRSYGLTTMRSQHLLAKAEELTFRFRGKGGKTHRVTLKDRRLARIVRTIQELPGQALFQFVDEDGELRQVSSEDVNDYIQEATGKDFTAKEFRTWRATVEALRILRCRAQEGPLTKRALKETICEVAQLLGNTPTICRKSYVHPRLQELPADGAEWLVRPLGRPRAYLEPVESLALRTLLRNGDG
jgi:DNA topoisomerase I